MQKNQKRELATFKTENDKLTKQISSFKFKQSEYSKLHRDHQELKVELQEKDKQLGQLNQACNTIDKRSELYSLVGIVIKICFKAKNRTTFNTKCKKPEVNNLHDDLLKEREQQLAIIEQLRAEARSSTSFHTSKSSQNRPKTTSYLDDPNFTEIINDKLSDVQRVCECNSLKPHILKPQTILKPSVHSSS